MFNQTLGKGFVARSSAVGRPALAATISDYPSSRPRFHTEMPGNEVVPVVSTSSFGEMQFLDLTDDSLALVFDRLSLKKIMNIRLVCRRVNYLVETRMLSKVHAVRIDAELDEKDTAKYDIRFDKYDYLRSNPKHPSTESFGSDAITGLFQFVNRLTLTTRFGVSIQRMQAVEFLANWAQTLKTLKLTLDQDLSLMAIRIEEQARLWATLNGLLKLKHLDLKLVVAQWIVPESVTIFGHLKTFSLTCTGRQVDDIVVKLRSPLKELTLENCRIFDFNSFRTGITAATNLEVLKLHQVEFARESYPELYNLISQEMKCKLVQLVMPTTWQCTNYLHTFLSNLAESQPSLTKLTLNPLNFRQLSQLTKFLYFPVLQSVTHLTLYFDNILPENGNVTGTKEICRNFIKTLKATLPKVFPSVVSIKITVECRDWLKQPQRPLLRNVIQRINDTNNALVDFKEKLINKLPKYMPTLTDTTVEVLWNGKPVERVIPNAQERPARRFQDEMRANAAHPFGWRNELRQIPVREFRRQVWLHRLPQPNGQGQRRQERMPFDGRLRRRGAERNDNQNGPQERER